jgi:hypothetical protein
MPITGVIPAIRLEMERERLRPLSMPPAECPLRFSIVVGPTAMVCFEGHGYSLAPEAIGVPGVLRLYPDRVRIQARRFRRRASKETGAREGQHTSRTSRRPPGSGQR